MFITLRTDTNYTPSNSACPAGYRVLANCWSGGTTGSETDWHTANNWVNGKIPTSTDNVIIPPVSNQPVISALAECQSLVILEGSSVYTVKEYLSIYGDLINDGTFTHDAAGPAFLESTKLKGTSNLLGGKGTFNGDQGPYLELVGGTYTLGHNVSIYWVVVDGTSTLSLSSYTLTTTRSTYCFSLNSGGTLNLNTGTLELKGSIPTFSGTFNRCTGAVYFSSNSTNQEVPGVSYYNLTIGTDYDVGGYYAHLNGTPSETHIYGTFTIESGAGFNTITASSYIMNVKGDWINNGTITNDFISARFNGTSSQTIKGTSVTDLEELVIDNSAGLTLEAPVNLNYYSATYPGELVLTNGVIKTDATNILSITDDLGFIVTEASNSSHVNGPIQKTTGSVTKFTFPTGDGTYYRPIAITPSNINATTWSAQYFNTAYSNLTVDATLDHVSALEYWTLGRSGATPADGTVELSWNVNSDVGTYTDLHVAHYDGATDWSSAGNNSITGNNTSGTLESNADWNLYSPFTLGKISASGLGILPIELLFFNAKCNNNIVELNWSTASEINNDYFTIEKCRDHACIVSDDWKIVTNINGAGNSNEIIYYSYTDENPCDGISYYRLKQTDFDGNFDYSDIKPVHCSFINADVNIDVEFYPNPFTNEITVVIGNLLSSTAEIEIYDMFGSKVLEQTLYNIDKNNNKFIISLSKFFKGTYLIKFTSDDFIKTQKIIKN